MSLMRHYGIPVTRQNYLELAYGEPCPELDAETDSYLPLEIQQRWIPVVH
jgi:hypothetical protein